MTRDRLVSRCLWRQASFSIACSLIVALAVPALLLLSNPMRFDTSLYLFLLLATGGAGAFGLSWLRLKRHRLLLRTLGANEGSPAEVADQKAYEAFIAEPYRLALGWLAPKWCALAVFISPWRPPLMDDTTGATVALLSVLTLATLALPLHALVRRDFLDVIELIPRPAMQKLLESAQLSGALDTRILRRLVVAVTMPVVFVSIGSALIVNAHLRHAEETSRRETARVLARASFEIAPGNVEGLKRAVDRARQLGFPAQIEAAQERYGVILDRDGVVELTTPLDAGSARVRFNASTIGVLSPAPVLVALLATVIAATLAWLLGTLLVTDLDQAIVGLRLLMTNPTLAAGGGTQLSEARVRPVAQLFQAIRGLADRFLLFARAQEAAIDARARATRMRGLFFASVSHDLKGPLNSILGFTQLVSTEPLSEGQKESLQTVHSRAQELLALIETILDAARVEEGHLSFMTDEVPFATLYDAAVNKAAQLCSGMDVQIYDEIERNLPPLLVDRVRVQRALATLIAYSVRSNPGGRMWVRAERESEKRMRIDIDVPKPQHAPTEIETMLAPTLEQGRREHRGLALALRLARSIVELHQGSVRVVDRGKKGAMFCVSLPTVTAPLPRASAPHHTIPAPPLPSSHPPKAH